MFKAIAPKLAANGYTSLLPLHSPGKRPRISEWQRYNRAAPEPRLIQQWGKVFPGAGIGLAFGPDRVAAVDLDFLDEAKAEKAEAILHETIGQTPMVRVGQAPKTMHFYRRTEDLAIAGKAFGGFEIFHRSGQAVLYSVHPDTGKPYAWPEASPLDLPAAELPVIDTATVKAFIDAMAPLREDTARTRHGTVQHSGQTGEWLRLFNDCETFESMVQSGVEGIAAVEQGHRHPTMISVVTALVIKGAPPELFEAAITDAYEKTLNSQELMGRHGAVVKAISWAGKAVWGSAYLEPLPELVSGDDW